MLSRSVVVAALAITATAATAAADPEDTPAPAPVAIAARLARDDAFTPTVTRASATPNGFVVAATTWDSVRDRAAMTVAGELTVWGPIRIVARVDDVTRGRARPSAGVAVKLLDESRHGVAASGYLTYKTEGWTAPDGELESALAFARGLGPVRATLGVAYGQDFEGNDRDGEVALAAHVAATSDVVIGVAGRYRDALGSTAEETIMKRELVAGAAATFTHDRYAISGLLGIAAVETASMPLTTGPAATVSFGTAF